MPPGGKTCLIRESEFRRKLGNISGSTLWRLQVQDPRFPPPGRLRNGHTRVWTEETADRYAELLAADRDDEVEAA